MRSLAFGLSLPFVAMVAMLAVVLWVAESSESHSGSDIGGISEHVLTRVAIPSTCKLDLAVRNDADVMYGTVLMVTEDDVSDIEDSYQSTGILLDIIKFKPGRLLAQSTPTDAFITLYTRAVSPHQVEPGDCIAVAGRTRFLTCGSECPVLAFWADEVRTISRLD